jgi:hypothetical protein
MSAVNWKFSAIFSAGLFGKILGKTDLKFELFCMMFMGYLVRFRDLNFFYAGMCFWIFY